MNRILESAKFVVDNSKDVKIDESKVNEFCKSFDSEGLKSWTGVFPITRPELSIQERVNFVFILNAVNFCYWGEPKWTIDYQGKKLDGALAMIGSIYRSKEEGNNLLDAKVLENLTEESFCHILRGNTTIPLFNERLDIFKQVGRTLNEKYQGSFVNLVSKAKNDVLNLISLLEEDFPSYRDEAEFKNRKIFFYKRAQLAIADLYKEFEGKDYGAFSNVNELTGFADYKIPQVLRKKDILIYSSEISKLVDSKKLIEKHSRKEIEIRANTVWAIELIRKNLAPLFICLTSADIDMYLWIESQDKKPDDKPYHLTRTTDY